jgi:hypothetical protein
VDKKNLSKLELEDIEVDEIRDYKKNYYYKSSSWLNVDLFSKNIICEKPL